MDLPNFEIEENQDQQQMDMFSQILSGASAPSNSLLAASMETFSYKANALSQQNNSQPPKAEDLLQKLIQSQQQHQTHVMSIDMGVYNDGIDYAVDSQSIQTSFALAVAALRADVEAKFTAQIEDIQTKFFQKLRMTDTIQVKEFLTSIDSFASGAADKYIQMVKNVKYICDTPDNQKLASYYIQNNDVQLVTQDLPGFSLNFIFEDNSELIVQFKLDPETQGLQDAKVSAITGYAAEVLGLIVKKRESGFFSEVIPLTEGEITILTGLYGQQQVKERIEKSYKHCKSILSKLSGMF